MSQVRICRSLRCEIAEVEMVSVMLFLTTLFHFHLQTAAARPMRGRPISLRHSARLCVGCPSGFPILRSCREDIQITAWLLYDSSGAISEGLVMKSSGATQLVYISICSDRQFVRLRHTKHWLGMQIWGCCPSYRAESNLHHDSDGRIVELILDRPTSG